MSVLYATNGGPVPFLGTALGRADGGGFDVEVVSLDLAIEMVVLDRAFDVIVVDLPVFGDHGRVVLREIVLHAPDVPLVVLVGADVPDGEELLASGVTEYLVVEEVTPAALQQAVRHAVARKSFEVELRRIADTDDLTGIGNRRHLARRHRSLVARQQRIGGVFVAAVFDLDSFKALNDAFGHPAGDRVLQMVAGRLGGAAREYDVVARLGGDEFVLLSLQASTSTAIATAERVHRSVRSALDDSGFAVDVSMGAVVAMEPRDLDALVGAADALLYRAKGLERRHCHLVL